jgi:two-component system response regulator AlgR
MSAVPALSVMIVDDEAPARARLRDLLADVAVEAPNVLVAEADNGWRAIEALEETQPDVMLVDVRMPEMDGIELACHVSQLDLPPAIVFVTAYDRYAVRAFELNAVDYLLKPVRAPRLAIALQKVQQGRRVAPQVLSELQEDARTHLSCHERGRLLLVPVKDVLYLKADFKYVTARTVVREYLLDESLTHLEQEYPRRFIRLHRGVLAARMAIAGFEKCASEGAETQWQALLREVPDKLPVSRRQWPLVRSYARRLIGS